MLSSSQKLVLRLVAKVMPIARATSITMEIPITMAMLKGLCPSQAVQSGQLGPCHDKVGSSHDSTITINANTKGFHTQVGNVLLV
jgi:hypothetical protein